MNSLGVARSFFHSHKSNVRAGKKIKYNQLDRIYVVPMMGAFVLAPGGPEREMEANGGGVFGLY
jgi:hypothetical protein